jgi:hypothetical protein
MSESEKADYVGDSLRGLKSVGDAAHKAGGALQGIGADVLSKATETVHDAQARSTNLGSDIAKQAEVVAETQRDGIADRLEGVAGALHRSAQDLREKEAWLAQLMDKGADEMTSFATTLRTSDFNSLVGNLQNLARRQPALFMGASVAAGFALARVGRLAVVGPSTEPNADPGEATQ